MNAGYNPHSLSGKKSVGSDLLVCDTPNNPIVCCSNLRPNLHDKHLSKLFVRSGMQYKICRDTYHMFYIIGSEDIFMRPVSSSSQTESSQPEITRQPKWTNWLESSEKGWCRSLSDQEKVQKEEEAMNKLGLPSADGDAMAVDSTETAVSN
jgi:histone deacetylase complex regulatory component SIN3